jgi:hypothetical protein
VRRTLGGGQSALWGFGAGVGDVDCPELRGMSLGEAGEAADGLLYPAVSDKYDALVQG